MIDQNVPIAERYHALYRFYDTADCLLYVGITANLLYRLSSHVETKPWWHEVARMTVEPIVGSINGIDGRTRSD